MKKILRFLSNAVRPKNWLYVIQGYYNRFIVSEYDRIADEGKIAKAILMAAKCPECAIAGACIECGCNFIEMSLSDKKCPNEKEG